MPDQLPNSSISDAAITRILDAAANRAGEGLRVIEDYVRFALDDAHLTRCCKELRHELTATLSDLNLSDRLAARETQADAGTAIGTPREYQRANLTEVLAANFARLEEALRSLEEYTKIHSPALSPRIEQLRYRAYTLHKAVHVTQTSIERLNDARIYVLIDGRDSLEEFQRLAKLLVNAGVDVLQLRDKKLDDRTLLGRAKALHKICSAPASQERKLPVFIMNDRPDLAVLASADGVHVGQEELPVHEVRKIVGPQLIIGVSTHSIEQARQAVLNGASYIGVGPTFPSGTKQFEQLAGLDFVRAVAAEIRLPAFAIGGTTLENVAQVTAAGLNRVAVSGAILNVADPAQAVKQFRDRLR